jgi:hypothetical protein
MAKTAVQQPAEKKIAVVGNRTTELIIGMAANKFASATTSLESMMDSYNKMKEEFDQTISDRTLQVVTLESKIEGLKQDLENKTTQNKIELQNQFNADKEGFVKAWLQQNGYTMIFTNELNTLKKDLADTKADVENQIKKAVTNNTELLTNAHNNEINTLKLTHEKEQADNKAKISLMDEKNKFLGEQVEAWKTAADEARKASVEIAKAGSVTQNFSGNGK